MDLVGPGANWKDSAAYAPLLGADRSIFAWEWLRRDPAYREAARQYLTGRPSSVRPDAWGLHSFEDPSRPAPAARPVWTARLHPLVLAAAAERPTLNMDAFDIAALGALATIVDGRTGKQHVLICDGLRAIRLDVEAGSLRQGPVQLRFLIRGIRSAERPLLSLRRLLALCRGGRFAQSLHPPDVRASRFILMLRANDAIAEGATQREIAATLLNAEAAEQRWRVNAPTLRVRAQRLVRAAKLMSAGGYRSLLR